MNQHRHIATQGRSDNHIPGRQSPQGSGFLSALKSERGYQQHYAAWQSLQHQLEQQKAAQAHYGQMQGQQHQPFMPMGWGGQLDMEARRLRPRDFSSISDMFDGGGAGQSGSTFQGGGLLSVLSNMAGAKPRGQG